MQEEEKNIEQTQEQLEETQAVGQEESSVEETPDAEASSEGSGSETAESKIEEPAAPTQQTAAAALAARPVDVEKESPFNWYVIRAISGKEKKIKQHIEIELQRAGFTNNVRQVVIPMEKVVKVKNGKKVIKERNMMPGYILVEAILNADIITTITQVSNVMHFLGKDNPDALRKSEVNKILGKVDELMEEGESMEIPYMVGETVKVTDGPFNDFSGVIEEIMEDKKKLKVMVKIFGRRTPLELNYIQVEKLS